MTELRPLQVMPRWAVEYTSEWIASKVYGDTLKDENRQPCDNIKLFEWYLYEYLLSFKPRSLRKQG